MAADSDSNIAWHRAQLRKHRENLKNLETARFTIGKIVGSKQTQKTLADLKRKVRRSEQIIAAHETQTKRPRATDQQSLVNVRWSSWG